MLFFFCKETENLLLVIEEPLSKDFEQHVRLMLNLLTD